MSRVRRRAGVRSSRVRPAGDRDRRCHHTWRASSSEFGGRSGMELSDGPGSLMAGADGSLDAKELRVLGQSPRQILKSVGCLILLCTYSDTCLS